MKSLHKEKLIYRALKRYFLFGFRFFYSDIIIRGEENLPLDENTAIIYAPNHLNALMDALAISYIHPHKKSVVYLARADMFAKKIVAKMLYMVKILPAYRMRDGMENLSKNNRSLDNSLRALETGQAVCIMPEGGQGEEQKVRPLVKGIFRLAFEAQTQLAGKKNVKIVPVGLYYDNLYKSGRPLIINIGEAIDIREYEEQHKESPAKTINLVRAELYSRLSDLTLNLATSAHYDSFETITDIMAEEFADESVAQKDIPYEKLRIKQDAAKNLIAIEDEKPELINELGRLCKKFNESLKKTRFKTAIFSPLSSEATSYKRFFALLISMPVAVFGLITNFLPVNVPEWLRKLMRVEYDGFYTSVKFGIGLIISPLLYIAQILLFAILISNSIGILVVFAALQIFTRRFAYSWKREVIKFFQKFRFNTLLRKSMKESSPVYELITVRNRIVHLVGEYKRKNS